MTEDDSVPPALADEAMYETERDYRVRWEIDVRATSRGAAAREARRVQLLPDSDALEFEVVEHDGAEAPAWEIAEVIDLAEVDRSEGDPERQPPVLPPGEARELQEAGR